MTTDGSWVDSDVTNEAGVCKNLKFRQGGGAASNGEDGGSCGMDGPRQVLAWARTRGEESEARRGRSDGLRRCSLPPSQDEVRPGGLCVLNGTMGRS